MARTALEKKYNPPYPTPHKLFFRAFPHPHQSPPSYSDLVNRRNLVLHVHAPRISVFKFKIFFRLWVEPVMFWPMMTRSVAHIYIYVGSLFGKFVLPELQLPLSEMLFFTSRSGNGIACFSTVMFFLFLVGFNIENKALPVLFQFRSRTFLAIHFFLLSLLEMSFFLHLLFQNWHNISGIEQLFPNNDSFGIANLITTFLEMQRCRVTVLILIFLFLDVISGIATVLYCSFGNVITSYDNSRNTSCVLDFIFGIAIISDCNSENANCNSKSAMLSQNSSDEVISLAYFTGTDYSYFR